MYKDACKWKLDVPMPDSVRHLTVSPTIPELNCRVVFSAVSSLVAYEIEELFASNGYIVVSNASAYRMEPDIPLIIPEVNPDHLNIINQQKIKRNYDRGFIVTNPNCSTIPLAMVLAPVKEHFGISKAIVTTLQAISGAGYPGVPALDIFDNIIPNIKNEEEKLNQKHRKFWGNTGEIDLFRMK